MNTPVMVFTRLLAVLSLIILASGCAGTHPFHQYARAGDTVAIATGWQPNWSRDNISVWVQEYGGSWVQYPANDPSIRAVVNFYPDPISSLVVSNRTRTDITPGTVTYGDTINNRFTSGSRDWFNTVVFFDLPQNMTLGTAKVEVEEVANTNNYVDSTIDIVGTGGQKDDFDAQTLGPMDRQYLGTLERATHYSVDLTGTGAVPDAVQLDFTHDPDAAHGGTGQAYVVAPISGVNSISWHDDGTNLRVIMMPSNGVTPASFKDFKFYVAGGITSLASVSTQAYDVNGAPVSGVSAPTITPHNIVIDTTN